MRSILKKNGLKGISTLIIIFFIVLSKGCNDTKVLDNDTSIKEIENNNKVLITEIKDPFKEEKYKRFIASYFKDGKIYGNLETIKPEIAHSNVPYIINEDGSFSENEINNELLEEYKYISRYSSKLLTKNYYKGIYEEMNQKGNEIKKIDYFVDIKENEKFVLENHYEYQIAIKENNNNFFEIYDFENYYFISYSNYKFYIYNKDDKSYVDKEKRRNQFLLIDEIDKKEYISEVMEEIPYIFFSKDEKAVMGVNNNGVIYKFIIKDNKIKKEEYSKIPLEDLGVDNLSEDTYSILYPKDNLLVFCFYAANNKTIIYNTENKQWNIIPEKETYIEDSIKNTDLFITSKNETNSNNVVYYLEKINENLEFEVVGKIFDTKEFQGEEKSNYLLNFAIGDKKESKAFITFSRYDVTGNYKDVKYFLVNINY